MQKNILKKELVIVIIVLFIEASVAPLVGSRAINDNNTTEVTLFSNSLFESDIIVDNDGSMKINKHKITGDELNKIKQHLGVYEEGRNYNTIINGYGTGLYPPSEEEWRQIAEETYFVDDISSKENNLFLLSSVDNMNDPWFPPIGNQGGEGSCTCFATVYYTKTYQEAKEHGWDLSGATWEGYWPGNPSEVYQDRIMSPDFVFHQISNGFEAGSDPFNAINLMSQIGVCTWKEMPNHDYDKAIPWPSESAYREAPFYRGKSNNGLYNIMILISDNKIKQLKTFLSNDRLAVIFIAASKYRDLTNDDLWTLDNYHYKISDINHANTIVGYDDNFGPYIEDGVMRTGAFKIANSWGIGGFWENDNDGCYWISYEAMKKRIFYCMFFDDIIDYKPKLVSVLQIKHPKRDDCDITIGIGDKNNPEDVKKFSDVIKSGNFPFPSNKIVYDITEFCENKPNIDGSNFFLKVYDKNSIKTGTISHFSIEYYDNYYSGFINATSLSNDPPVNTIQNNNVFAETILTINNNNNPPNKAVDPFPNIDATFVPTDTKLGCYVDDPNGCTLDVIFYWKQNSDTDFNVLCGSRAEIDPGILDPGKTYWWYVEVYDGEYYRESDHWRFHTSTDNTPPNKPSKPDGPISGKINTLYNYNTMATDDSGDQLYYYWLIDYGWDEFVIGPYDSGETMDVDYEWNWLGTHEIKVQAVDEWGIWGDLSDPLSVTIPRNKAIENLHLMFFENHPLLFRLLRLLFKQLLV